METSVRRSQPCGPQPSGGMSGARLANGTRLNDRYEIEEFLGRTPYGESYRARDMASGQLVAIKALNPALIGDGATMERLTREVQVATQLDHKNIAATYGLFGAQVGADPWPTWRASSSTGRRCARCSRRSARRGRAFSLKGAYNVIAHLCNALVYAHGATVHGALTPDSVMVNSAGRVKLTDFGLARDAQAARQLRARRWLPATMAALAPEMVASPEAADARADIYSVGVILFELLTGRTPADSFERPSVAAPGVPPAVDPVIEQLPAAVARRALRRRADAQGGAAAGAGRRLGGGRTRRRQPPSRCRRARRRKRAASGDAPSINPPAAAEGRDVVRAQDADSAAAPASAAGGRLVGAAAASGAAAGAAPPVAGAGRGAEVVQRRRRALRRRRHARALADPEGQARLRPVRHEGSPLADRAGQDSAASTSSSTPRTASASR